MKDAIISCMSCLEIPNSQAMNNDERRLTLFRGSHQNSGSFLNQGNMLEE